MSETKIIDTAGFIEANQEADKLGYNRLVTDEFLGSLDPDGTHILQFSMPHEHAAGMLVHPHMRTIWLMKVSDSEKPVEGVTLDMTLDRFNSLTTLRKNEDGEFEVVIGAHGVGRK